MICRKCDLPIPYCFWCGLRAGCPAPLCERCTRGVLRSLAAPALVGG